MTDLGSMTVGVREMTNTQHRKLVRAMARAIPGDLSYVEADAIIGKGKNGSFVARIHRVFEGERIPPLFLEPAGTVTIPATTEPFVAREKFIVGNAEAGIRWIEIDFHDRYLGKTEKPLPEETVLCYVTLGKYSAEGPILAELGDNKPETTLAQIYALMRRQKNDGEEGVLLNNWWANIFFVRDVNGKRCQVNVHWYSNEGWRVLAGSDSPNMLAVGSRVFFNNS